MICPVILTGFLTRPSFYLPASRNALEQAHGRKSQFSHVLTVMLLARYRPLPAARVTAIT